MLRGRRNESALAIPTFECGRGSKIGQRVGRCGRHAGRGVGCRAAGDADLSAVKSSDANADVTSAYGRS